MLLNGCKIELAKYVEETLEDEMIIYNEDVKSLISLNETAILVWKEIVESYQEKKDIYSEDIVQKIIQMYDISQFVIDDIKMDVKETIESFIGASLLKLEDITKCETKS